MALCHDNPAWCFAHLYRTGGTSIRRAIEGAKLKTWEIGGWHWSLDQVRAHCATQGGLEWYERALKLITIRNPYDWLVSIYRYRTGASNPINALQRQPFGVFVRAYCEQLEIRREEQLETGANAWHTLLSFIPADMHLHPGTLIVKHENLGAEWQTIASLLGIPGHELPHVNASKRKPDYRSYYDDATREYVARYYARGIERFRYEF